LDKFYCQKVEFQTLFASVKGLLVAIKLIASKQLFELA